MSLSALRSVGDAIDVTREFMTPVSVRRWVTMAVVVLFMGTPGTPVPANPQFLDPTLWGPPEPRPAGEPAPQQFTLDVPSLGELPVPPVAEWPRWAFLALGALAVAALAYVAVGVVMRFVIVEAMRADRVRLLAHARSNLGNAARVLGFRAVLAAVALVPAGAGVAYLTPLGPAPLDGTAAWLVGGLVTVAVGLVWLVDAVTLQFVLPTMLREEVGVVAGWRRLWPTLSGEPTEYVAFAVVRAVLGAAVGIAAVVVLAVAVALGGVLFVTVGAAIVLLGGGIGGLSTPAIAALAVVGLVFLAYGVAVYGLITVPFQVYLWAYALLVLGDTDEGLDLIPEFRASAREEDLPPA